MLRHVERLRADDAAAVAAVAGPRARDVEPLAIRDAPHRRHYAGLESYCAYLQGRREVLHAELMRYWRRLERQRFADRIESRLD